MPDKTADVMKGGKGKAYCEKPGTSCCYNSQDVCVNCQRPKGWRIHKWHRAQLDRNAGR